MPTSYDIRRAAVNSPTNCGVESFWGLRQPSHVLDTDALLARLKAKGVKNIDIARALGLPDSRVPEIKRKDRKLKLDEAVKLVRAFGLEQAPTQVVPESILRLAVRYVAAEVGSSPSEEMMQELTQDIRAFAEFVGDPNVRPTIEGAEGFFRAMRLRRPAGPKAVRQGSDPDGDC